MSGRTLVLLRHGRTPWNASGRAQGQADVPLDDTGHAQAAAAAPYVASLAPAALWSSDLLRARQTCGYLEETTGLGSTPDKRLREFDVGEREGLLPEEFAERFPREHAVWLRGSVGAGVLGAETDDDVAERMLPALRECLAALGPGETGVVVGHGAALRVGLVALLGWPAEQAQDLRGMDNCCWSVVQEHVLDGRLRLLGYNQTVRHGRDEKV